MWFEGACTFMGWTPNCTIMKHVYLFWPDYLASFPGLPIPRPSHSQAFPGLPIPRPSHRPVFSVFAYYKQYTTGRWEDLGMRLATACVLPRSQVQFKCMFAIKGSFISVNCFLLHNDERCLLISHKWPEDCQELSLDSGVIRRS